MIRRWWLLLVASPFLAYGVLMLLGPVGIMAVVAIALAVAAGKPLGMRR